MLSTRTLPGAVSNALSKALSNEKMPTVRNETSGSPLASGVTSVANSAAIAVQRFPVGHKDESLSRSETMLMIAAFSTLLCSIMLGVLIP